MGEEDGLGYADALAQVAPPANAVWRPFQLAFVLLNLPSLANPTHPERAANPDATVDLLFFPTGGGKTEAAPGYGSAGGPTTIKTGIDQCGSSPP